MGIDRSFEVAFAKSQLGAGSRPPTSGAVFVSVRDADKEKIVEPLRKLQALGFKILATGEPSVTSPPAGLRRRRSTRSRRAARSRGAVATAPCSSCSTPPRARPRSPIRSPCAAPPSCKRALLHHNFRRHRSGRRHPRRRGWRTRSQGVAGLSGVTALKKRGRGGNLYIRIYNGQAPNDRCGPCSPGGGISSSPAGRAAAHRRGDFRGAISRRPVGECRISLRQGGAVA